MSRDSTLYVKCKRFASRICRLYAYLQNEKGEKVISAQIVRSGTSIGANVAEALYASSRRDFLNKITIALKECSETSYWLDILDDNGYFESAETRSIVSDCTEILKMLISTSKTLKADSTKRSVEYDCQEEPDFSNPLNAGGCP